MWLRRVYIGVCLITAVIIVLLIFWNRESDGLLGNRCKQTIAIIRCDQQQLLAVTYTEDSKPTAEVKVHLKQDLNQSNIHSNYSTIHGDLPQLPSVPQRSSPIVPRAMNACQYTRMFDLIKEMLCLFRLADIQPVMMFGTLVGSYVTHDILPWDDDMDVILHLKELPRLKRLFRDNPDLYDIYGIHSFREGDLADSEFDLKTLQTFPMSATDDDLYKIKYRQRIPEGRRINHKLKFFYKKGLVNFKSYKWTWPFIDISFYTENKTHVWLVEKPDRCSIPRESMYPLTYRPLGPIWMLAPFDSQALLTKNYRMPFICGGRSWNHRREEQEIAKSADCKVLFSHYPFVERESYDGIIFLEKLYLNGSLIYTVKLNGSMNSSDNYFSIHPSIPIANLTLR